MTAKGAKVEMEFANPEDAIIQHASLAYNEQKLWLAVLELAWRDAIGTCRDNRNDGDAEHNTNEAQIWFASDDDGPLTLKWVLRMTGIKTTPSQLRARLKWRKQ